MGKKMSSLPPPEEVAGPYVQQYEVYYKKLDPDGKNEIGAMDAAGFLKKSGLTDEQLGKIWDLSDPNGKGFLDKAGLFVACKMVALVQSDTPLTIDNARVQCPAPNFGADTAPGAPVAKVAPKKGGNVNFLVKPEEKRKYDALFDQLQPQEEALPGDKVPNELPEELAPEKVPKSLSAVPNINGAPKPVVQQAAPGPVVDAIPWVVNAGDRYRYNVLFKQTDSDKDGFVSGIEIKNVFLQTGLPQNILAHIWNLCDINQEGKLNPEQFALAMWLINRKQSGKDPPAALTPDMMPPSMRPKGQDAGTGSNVYNNPELEMIAKDIQALLSEKIQLEKESQSTDYNMSVKKTEQHSLQSEYDTLASTLKQLTNQKDVAQKRLDDLDTQIEKLRTQADEQEATLLAQEEEVHGKQRELERLKSEETELLQNIKNSEKEIERLEHDLSITGELTTEVCEQTENLTTAEKHMTTALAQFNIVEEAGDGGDYSSI